MAKPQLKIGPSKRRRPNSAAYWTLFIVCSLLSFGGGFYFTYRGTQIVVKEPTSGATMAPVTQEATDSSLATDSEGIAAVVPGPSVSPTPVDPFAVAPEPTPSPQATAVREIVATSAPSPSEAPTQPPERDRDAKTWKVQVGNYETQGDAQAMVDELSAASIRATVAQDDEGMYHAQIGDYRERDAALHACDDVYAKGYSASIR